MSWALVIMLHVGAIGSGNSNALNSIRFHSKDLCEASRREVEKLASGTVKEINTVCVRVK